MTRADAIVVDEVAWTSNTPALHTDALVWDQHGCLPLRPDPDAVEELELYRAAGVDVVSVNVGMDGTPTVDALGVLAAFRRGLRARDDRFLLVSSIADIDEAKRSGRLAVTFDLEGTEPLDGDVALVEVFYELGVRTMLIAYNRRNRAGGGCHDDPTVGLTDYGRRLLREMNRLGMLVDASHCSPQTTFDLFEHSQTPVIFSHSVPAAVKPHERNVSDEQMRACAATGGVVGINGVGLFLGDNDASTDALVRALSYAVEVVGPEHVGLGLDYVFDKEELHAYLRDGDSFPADAGYRDDVVFASPLQLPDVTDALLELGLSQADVRRILGGNFLRVARQVWDVTC